MASRIGHDAVIRIRDCGKTEAGGVWWSTLGMKPPDRMRGLRRSNSARMAASPRGITILS